MSNQIFAFKQFTVRQDKCAMKVGTDAVLLGAWANISVPKNILDAGTGTGIIALMLAQRTSVPIDAIDIDEAACRQARENIHASPWKERIKIHHQSLQVFAKQASIKYDLIVSNPPYFTGSSKSQEEARMLARHTDLLSYDALLEGVLKLLSPAGRFCVVFPIKEGELFRDKAQEKKLYLTKLTRVHTRADKTEKRLLMQYEFERKTFSENHISIELNTEHHYTEEYKELTKDFYLHF